MFLSPSRQRWTVPYSPGFSPWLHHGYTGHDARSQRDSTSQGFQLPPHPLRVPHSAHLGEEALGFAEVALETRIIAQERGEFGAALVQGGGEEQDAVLVDQGRALVEEALSIPYLEKCLSAPPPRFGARH